MPRQRTIEHSAGLLARAYGDMLKAFDATYAGHRRDRDRAEGQYQGERAMLCTWLRDSRPNIRSEDLIRALARATDAQKAEHGERPSGPQDAWDAELAERFATAIHAVANGRRF